MSEVQEAASGTPMKTFYSAAANLVVNINVGHRITESNGISRMVGQKVAEFAAIGDGYGRLTTSDPEIIEKLSARCMSNGDVFEQNEYIRRSTPEAMLLKMAEAENKRLVEDYNRLLAQVRTQEVAVQTAKVEKEKAQPSAQK